MCPTCGAKLRVLRTYPDPTHHSRDIIRECTSPACGRLFAYAESLVREIKTPGIPEILDALRERMSALPADQQQETRLILREL